MTTQPKECMICKKKLDNTGGFTTLNGGNLCAEDYRRVSYYHRKGVFTTEEAEQVKTMMEEETAKRQKIFEQLNRVAVTNKWTVAQYKKHLNTTLDLLADEDYHKNGAQFLNSEQLTLALQKTLEILRTKYGSDDSVSLARAPYSHLTTQYYYDVDEAVEFSRIATYDVKDTLDKLIKVSN